MIKLPNIVYRFLGSIAVLIMTPAALLSQTDNKKAPDVPPIELIHYGDLIDVDVAGSLDHDWRGSISPEGFLDGLPQVETPIYALCRSTEQIAADITAQYSRFLRDPIVNVTVLDRSNRALAILNGAVRNPTRFRIKRPVVLRELIILTGGITELASGEISVFRPKALNCLSRDNQAAAADAEMIRIRISDLIEGSASANPYILSGDIVTVVEAPPVFMTGGVVARKRLPFREDLTVSRAIASAGGLTPEADAGRITIFRREAGRTVPIAVDLDKVRDGKADDVPLKPFDIVEAAESGRPGTKLTQAASQLDRDNRQQHKLTIRVIE